MEETQDNELYEQFCKQFDLDKDNPFIGWFVEKACEAGAKLYVAFRDELMPACAFNEFITAWEYYYIMPEETKTECEGVMKIFRSMWSDVSKSEAELFCATCNSILHGEEGQEDILCKYCIEYLEAICVLTDSLPNPISIATAAMNVAISGYISSNTCIALLYILCARIWYRCLGCSCDKEEALLSEGLKYHLKAKADSLVYLTELYSIHIAAAIYDITYLRLERGCTQKDVFALVKEGYSMLEQFNSPQVEQERQSLYECSGISTEVALYGERRYSLLPNHKNGRLPN